MNEQTAKKRWFHGRRTLAIILAVAICVTAILAGTFAWNAISQIALNENMDTNANPGGRLHDDFDGKNLDVYVENFGTNPIYAKVKLTEYMEIGSGAGTRGTYNPSAIQQDGISTGVYAADATNGSTPLKTGALIGDSSTWTVHAPLSGVDDCTTGGGGIS